MSENLSTIDEHATVDQAVCDALGLDRDAIMAMGLRTFFERAAERGFDVVVKPSMPAVDRKGRLTVTMEPPARHVDLPDHYLPAGRYT